MFINIRRNQGALSRVKSALDQRIDKNTGSLQLDSYNEIFIQNSTAALMPSPVQDPVTSTDSYLSVPSRQRSTNHDDDGDDEFTRAFLSWVEQVQSFEVIDPETRILRPFVAAEDMRSHFEQDDYRWLKKAIAAHNFPNSNNLWHDDIIPDNVAVFCTLLSISKGWWMKQFCHHGGLSDTALPFNPTRPPHNWPVGADFLPQFCEAQWRFCAQVLRAPFINKRFAKEMVLPIVFKETLNTEGSSACLRLIKIHPSYNKLISEAEKKVRAYLCFCIYRVKQLTDVLQRLGPLANTFVMKTYFTTEAERYYNTEVAAFRHLGLNPSIIRFHGSFTRGDSYNVLLEYADKGTLGDYFKNESPPSGGEEIIRFWEIMFELIDALRRVHEVESDASSRSAVFQRYIATLSEC